jgi:hypothetical protein
MLPTTDSRARLFHLQLCMMACCLCLHLQVSVAEIKRAQKAEREAEKMKGLMRARFDFLDME